MTPSGEINPETFHSMNHLLRRYQQPLLIVFTIALIISFVGYFNGTRTMGRGDGASAGQIYGRGVTQLELLRAGHDYELAGGLGMNDLVKALCDIQIPGLPEEMISMYLNQLPPKYSNDFKWNLLIFRQEAERLGITSTQEERDEAIKQMPVFQNNGAFDSSRLKMFASNWLPAHGMSDEGFEELVGDQIKLRKLLAILSATTEPSPAEVRFAYDQHYQKTECSVVRLKLDDFLAAATAPEDDVKKLYEDRKAQLNSAELRKVKVAAFTLPKTDTPPDPKKRAEELGKLGKAAEDFTVALTEKDAKFDEAAAKAGAQVEETAEFTQNAPPPALAAVPAAASAVFKLTAKEPVSEVLTDPKNGYYVVQLTGTTPARPLTFDEAKAQLAEQIKSERAREALDLKAKELRGKIAADLKAGKTLADAAHAAGAKAETFPAFSASEPNREQPDAREVMTATFDLKDGELSDFTPSPAGGFLLHIDKRTPADDAKFATDKTMIADNMMRLTRSTLFSEWLKLRRAEAHIQTPTRS